MAALRRHFIAEQDQELLAADRAGRLPPDQRAQMRQPMTARQPLHPDDHACCAGIGFAFHAASTTLSETVLTARSGRVSEPRVR
jgi:hypothetical protein